MKTPNAEELAAVIRSTIEKVVLEHQPGQPDGIIAITAGVTAGLLKLYEDTLNPIMNELDEKRLTRKLEDHKAEIERMLSRHNIERGELRQTVDQALIGVSKQVSMVHQGLNRAEGRINAMWNTFQSFVRFYEGEMSGRWEDFKDNVGLLAQSKFLELFKQCGTEVFNEAMEHERSELARLKEGKKQGQVLKMNPRPLNLGDHMMNATVQVVQKETPKHKPMLDELHKLRSVPPGRNDPCPCESGKKYKKCHGFDESDASEE